MTAAIDYGAAVFVDSLLNLWFGTSQTATAIFVIFTIIIAAHLLINLAALPILNAINTFSAWWHMVGVVLIVLVLIAIPDHHQSVGTSSARRSTTRASPARASRTRSSGSCSGSAC